MEQKLKGEISSELKTTSQVEGNDSFDWGSYLNGRDHIFSHKNKNNIKLTTEQEYNLSLYEGKNSFNKKVEEGLIVTGQIKFMTKREMQIDFNYKDYIYVENKISDWATLQSLKEGDIVDVLIKEIQSKPVYMIKGSVMDLLRRNVDNKIKTFFEENTPIVAVVNEIIPAGFMLTMEIDKVKVGAFMPNTLADVNRLYDPQVLLGKQINVLLETTQQEKGVYVVSRKKYLRTLIPEMMEKLDFEQKYEGLVTGTTPFGVFVQFEGCLTGMIHKANVNSEWRDRIEEIKPGTLMVFYIKEITKNDKIILTQTLEDSLWDTINVGMILDGDVVAMKPFGALVKLDYETIGLIQISYLNKYKKHLAQGDKISVKVVNVLKDDRKIYLSLYDKTRVKETTDNTNYEQ
jgi:ribosomal protein S1